jgi:hypothetical protein
LLTKSSNCAQAGEGNFGVVVMGFLPAALRLTTDDKTGFTDEISA